MNPTSNTEYVQQIALKLEQAQKDGMFSETLKVRDEEGIMQCFSRLLETASTYYFQDPRKTQDPAIAMANFSMNNSTGSSLGVSGAANLATMDAMDISIAAAVFSLIPYLAIERDMTSSSTNISYQDIVAEYANGDLAAGETVLGAFQAPNTKLNMALPTKTGTSTNDSDAATTLTLNLGTAIIPESISAQLISSSDVVSTGFDHNGTLYFTGSTAIVSTVNYKTGVISAIDVPAGYTLSVAANIDSTSDTSGTSILTVTPEYTNVLLTATPQLMIFKDNSLKNAYLNKLNVKLAGTNAALDYGQVAIGKLVAIYVHYVNRLVVNASISAGQTTYAKEVADGLSPVTTDISAYTGSGAGTGYADTKFDYIKSFIIELNQRSLDTCGKGITAILTGAKGANKLASCPDFVKSADFQELNAMIGTYDGIPVIRHQNINKIEPLDKKTAYFFGVYKDPSGSAAPVAFGEFLPVQVSDKVANYNNPTQIASALNSYCGVAVCVPGLAHLATMKVLA